MRRHDHELLFGKDLLGGAHELVEGTVAATFWRD
jgi:hypothetical protein